MKQFEGTMSQYLTQKDFFEAKANHYQKEAETQAKQRQEILEVLKLSHENSEYYRGIELVSRFIKEME